MELLDYLYTNFGPDAWVFYATLLFVFALELINPKQDFREAWDGKELIQTLALMLTIAVCNFFLFKLSRYVFSEPDIFRTRPEIVSEVFTGWLYAIAGLLVFDFLFYWKHRFMHVSALWPIHAVHHSATKMNFTVGFRGHPIDDFITTSAFIVIYFTFLDGYRGAIVLLAYSVYQASLHSNTEISFGPLDRIFVSPAVHHVHHQTADKSINKNFASMFSFYDVLFGTYRSPNEATDKSYGLKGGKMFGNTIDLLLVPITPKRARTKSNDQHE